MQGAVIEEARDALRKAALARRNALSPITCHSWSRSIQDRAIALPAYKTARCVAVYCTIGNEVETRDIRRHAWQEGKRVFCPKSSRTGAVIFAELVSDSNLIVGEWGVAEPRDGALLIPDVQANLIVFVPGLLFDGRGNRVGRGGGWYDRALQGLGHRGTFVGLAYECQMIERIPEQVWDQKVHYVITEKRVIACAAALQSHR